MCIRLFFFFSSGKKKERMNKSAYTYVDEHLISPSLICPICLEILDEPYTHVPCDSAFCRSCLVQLTEPLCPICRWTWDENIPIDFNIYLPKANRLIRNMLDDLMVQCRICQTVRRRGQFEHQCQQNGQMLVRISRRRNSKESSENLQTIFSNLVIFVFLLFIYHYRDEIFEQGINRQHELIQELSWNIDDYLLNKLYDFIMTIIEYSMMIFIINMCVWLGIFFYGDRFISKTTSQLLRKFFEIAIIINMITYSLYN